MPDIEVGVVFRPQLPPERLQDIVEAAEAAGMAELWWEATLHDLERAGATSVVFQGSGDAPDPIPLLAALPRTP